MTLIPKNDRVPVQKLGDPLLVGETYPNAGSQYKVLKVEGYYGDAWVQNIKADGPARHTARPVPDAGWTDRTAMGLQHRGAFR